MTASSVNLFAPKPPQQAPAQWQQPSRSTEASSQSRLVNAAKLAGGMQAATP